MVDCVGTFKSHTYTKTQFRCTRSISSDGPFHVWSYQRRILLAYRLWQLSGRIKTLPQPAISSGASHRILSRQETKATFRSLPAGSVVTTFLFLVADLSSTSFLIPSLPGLALHLFILQPSCCCDRLRTRPQYPFHTLQAHSLLVCECERIQRHQHKQVSTLPTGRPMFLEGDWDHGHMAYRNTSCIMQDKPP